MAVPMIRASTYAIKVSAPLAFISWPLAGCARERHYIGSGYATSTTSSLDPVITFVRSISWKREVTLGDIATASAAIVAVLALWLAWGQLKGLGLQTRA